MSEQEDVQKHLSGMTDSVNVINETVAEEATEESLDLVWRNWKHLEIMLAKDFISNSGEDLTVFEEAITVGKSYAPDNDGE